MRLEGDFTIRAPASRLWDLLWDLETLGSCVPGCESVQRVDDKTYTGVVKARVGPVHARFQARVTLLEVEAPLRLTLRVEGQDERTASQARARVELTLAPLAPDSTRASYAAELTVVGRLAQFGDGIIRETARMTLEEFVRNVQARLERGTTPALASELNLTSMGAHAVARNVRTGISQGLGKLRRRQRPRGG